MHSYDYLENCKIQRLDDNNTLKHYGILGQKWGIKRFQNADGSLTPEGYMRYYGVSKKQANEAADSGYEPSAHRLTEKGLTELVGLEKKTAKEVFKGLNSDGDSEVSKRVEKVVDDILKNRGSMKLKDIKTATKNLGKVFKKSQKKSSKILNKASETIEKAKTDSKNYENLIKENNYYNTQFNNATSVIDKMSGSSINLVDQIAEGQDFRQIRVQTKHKSDEQLAKEIARMSLENGWARQYATKAQYGAGRHAAKTAIKGVATAATVALGVTALKQILSNS